MSLPHSPHVLLLTVCRVLGTHRKLLGYIEVATLKKKWEAGEVNPVSDCTENANSPEALAVSSHPQTDKIASCMTKFNRSPTTNPYTVITPDTPLAELESFLGNHIFALSTHSFISSANRWTHGTPHSHRLRTQVRPWCRDVSGPRGKPPPHALW